MATGYPVKSLKWLANAVGSLIGYTAQDGSDVELWKKGTLANRPAASAYNIGSFYFADDTDGGTLYGNLNGIAWSQLASGLSAEVAYTTTTWALRGTGSFVGQIKRVTDLGNKANVFIVWDGTYWQPLGGSQLVYSLSATLLGTNADPSVITLPGFTVPAGLMNINGGLIIEMHSSITDGTATTGNVPSYTFGGFELLGFNFTTGRQMWLSRRIRNNGTTGNQVVMAHAGATGAYVAVANDPKTTSKDTTAAVAMAGTITSTTGGARTAQLNEFKIWWIGG